MDQSQTGVLGTQPSYCISSTSRLLSFILTHVTHSFDHWTSASILQTDHHRNFTCYLQTPPCLPIFTSSFCSTAGDRFGSLSMDENSYRSTPSSASISYNNSGTSNTNFRDSRNNNSNSNSSSNNTSEWKKSANQNTTSRDNMYSSRDHAPHSNSSNSNLKAEGWRGSSSNLASDVSNQSTVSGSVLAARTAIDKVLRYDKSTFLAVYGTVKKLPEYQEAPGILK